MCKLLFYFFNCGVYLFKHLHTKGRKDDLFTDPCYQQFGEELNKVLKDWQPSVLPDGQYCLILTFNYTVDSKSIKRIYISHERVCFSYEYRSEMFSSAFQCENVFTTNS